MARPAILMLAASLALASPAVAQQPRPGMAAEGRTALDERTGSDFACQGGGNLRAQFVVREAELVAIVDAGDGPHVLPLKPWRGGPPEITWSDGRRTLTWSPTVQLHWMDGAVHKSCGRSGHKH